jgi:hypothetical protein
MLLHSWFVRAAGCILSTAFVVYMTAFAGAVLSQSHLDLCAGCRRLRHLQRGLRLQLFTYGYGSCSLLLHGAFARCWLLRCRGVVVALTRRQRCAVTAVMHATGLLLRCTLLRVSDERLDSYGYVSSSMLLHSFCARCWLHFVDCVCRLYDGFCRCCLVTVSPRPLRGLPALASSATRFAAPTVHVRLWFMLFATAWCFCALLVIAMQRRCSCVVAALCSVNAALLYTAVCSAVKHEQLASCYHR